MSLAKKQRAFLENLIREGDAQQYHMRQKTIARHWADFTHGIHCLLAEVDRLAAIVNSLPEAEDVIPKSGYFIEEEEAEKLIAMQGAARMAEEVEKDYLGERLAEPPPEGETQGESEFYPAPEARHIRIATLKLENRPTTAQLQEEETWAEEVDERLASIGDAMAEHHAPFHDGMVIPSDDDDFSEPSDVELHTALR